MATVSSALQTISRHHLECCICQGRYQQPKILECLHSFCEQCLLKYYSTKHQGCTEIPCPMCRQETKLPEAGVQGLKTNFHLIGLVEEIELQEKVVSLGDAGILCGICKEANEATHRCLDCDQNLCSACSEIHLRFAVSSNHKVTPLKDIREGRVTLTKKHLKQHPKCPIHEGEGWFFCTTCEVLICRDCTVLDHRMPEHVYIARNLATSTYKESLGELFSPLENVIKELQKSQEKVSRLKEDLSVTAKRVTTEVQDRADKIRAEVTAQENRILDNIKNIQTDLEQKLEECEKTASLAVERFQFSLDTAREVTSTASDSDFLSLYPTISKDLKLLAGQAIPRVDDRLAFLKFKQSEGVGDINLGEVVVTEGKWELCGEFGRQGSGPGEFDWAWGIAARQPDEIAVTDYWNQRVVICSINGNQKSTIPMQGSPRGIAATRTNNRLLVVQENASHVKVFNSDNTLAYEFLTVPPSEVGRTAVDLWSVAVKNDGTILVGDVKRLVLTEHSPADGELLSTIPVKVAPCYLAVDSNDRIVISSESQTVNVADGNGTTRCTIKPIIDGQPIQCCNGVYTDSSGIYAAMVNGDNTGHIHHYDPQGGFLKCIAQGLYYPVGITFTSDGQLAVADFYSVKMYHQV